jgi:3-keto-5-aminohexanoate cleavage enzyme
VPGGQTGKKRDFDFLVNSIPAHATYSVAGIGKYEFPLAELAIIDGGHVRVGLEDNIYLEKGVKAKGNKELVEKVVELAKLHNREIATPNEARKILGLKERHHEHM